MSSLPTNHNSNISPWHSLLTTLSSSLLHPTSLLHRAPPSAPRTKPRLIPLTTTNSHNWRNFISLPSSSTRSLSPVQTPTKTLARGAFISSPSLSTRSLSPELSNVSPYTHTYSRSISPSSSVSSYGGASPPSPPERWHHHRHKRSKIEALHHHNRVYDHAYARPARPHHQDLHIEPIHSLPNPRPSRLVHANPPYVLPSPEPLTTEANYHIQSLLTPTPWVASLTLRSTSCFNINDVSEDDMEYTVLEMLNDESCALWQELYVPELGMVWKGVRGVEFVVPTDNGKGARGGTMASPFSQSQTFNITHFSAVGEGEGWGEGSGERTHGNHEGEEEDEEGTRLVGNIVVYAPWHVRDEGRTGGVRIVLCHKMSLDSHLDRVASGLFLRHLDIETASKWQWMIFPDTKLREHPQLDWVGILERSMGSRI